MNRNLIGFPSNGKRNAGTYTSGNSEGRSGEQSTLPFRIPQPPVFGSISLLCLLAISFLAVAPAWAQTVTTESKPVSSGTLQWQVVVNNSVLVPGDTRNFNSYNQPSVNANRMVVFRARSKGGSTGEPAHGVFVRDMALGTPLVVVFDRNTTVPQPNNTGATFNEPPSFPRIDISSNTIASRGNFQPVWGYFLEDGLTAARAGTTGIFTNPFGLLVTGASNLGSVPDFSFFEVPGTNGIKFDVFPGAPSITDGDIIVFKGNYSLPDPTNPGATIAETGVYFRVLTNAQIPLLNGDTPLAPAAGTNPVVRIADSTMYIPGTTTRFGSLAPPTAASGQAVFAGFDNEDNPTAGGIYMAPLQPDPPLTTLIAIGSQVPGERKGTVFNKLSETLSFDGRFVAFWGAWGNQTTKLTLQCPRQGNKVRIAYCNKQYPTGYKTTVPVHQGVFVYDTRTGGIAVVAKTPTNYADFIYWKFTGFVPGMGEGDGENDTGEPARWRSDEFIAVSGAAIGNLTKAQFLIAFKARTGQVNPATGAYENPVDGIYLRGGPTESPIVTAVQTGTAGQNIDSAVPLGLTITDMGVECDGFRGGWLAINVMWGTEDSGWAGIYLTEVKNRLLN